jgi:hypothetical protein
MLMLHVHVSDLQVLANVYASCSRCMNMLHGHIAVNMNMNMDRNVKVNLKLSLSIGDGYRYVKCSAAI